MSVSYLRASHDNIIFAHSKYKKIKLFISPSLPGRNSNANDQSETITQDRAVFAGLAGLSISLALSVTQVCGVCCGCCVFDCFFSIFVIALWVWVLQICFVYSFCVLWTVFKFIILLMSYWHIKNVLRWWQNIFIYVSFNMVLVLLLLVFFCFSTKHWHSFYFFILFPLQSLNWTVRMASDMESQMVSVERVKQYSIMEQERPHYLQSDPLTMVTADKNNTGWVWVICIYFIIQWV